jgi:ABC-2 type transport system ATP-binding protein
VRRFPHTQNTYVAQNLAQWLQVTVARSRCPDPSEDRIAEVLDLLDLTDLADRRIGSLSRGQNQRAGLAKAFLGQSPILLLDEPMSGLDPSTTGRLASCLRELADQGHTVVVSGGVPTRVIRFRLGTAL